MKDRRMHTPLDFWTPFCGGVIQGIQFGCLYCGTEETEDVRGPRCRSTRWGFCRILESIAKKSNAFPLPRFRGNSIILS